MTATTQRTGVGHRRPRRDKRVVYSTELGRLYHGDSLELLGRPPLNRTKNGVQLVFTSPPFPLNRKKRHGNLQGKPYVKWLGSRAPQFVDYLTLDGSMVAKL